MQYVRVYADEAGVSHFGDVEVDFTEGDFAPPAAPMGVSDPTPTDRIVFLLAPVEWAGDWHPTPCRQFAIILSGQVDVHVGDGETRRFGPGEVALLEDTTGTGHLSTVPGDEPATIAMVQMPD